MRNCLPRQARSYHTSFEGVADREARNFQTGNSHTQYQIYWATRFAYVNCLSEHEPIHTLQSSSKRSLTLNVADTVLSTRDFFYTCCSGCLKQSAGQYS